METKVAIIGAGVSGLAALRVCLQEGVDVTCYELTDHVGGLWRYREDIEEDSASVFWSIYANTSKEMSAFSEFPPEADVPLFPHHTKWYQYICNYAVAFGLLNHIRFCHKVTRVTRAEEIQPGDARITDKTLMPGQWVVEVLDIRNDHHSVHIYDAVMVCSGQTAYGIMPAYPGLENFKGQKLHSARFRKPEPFQGQRVLVVGFGNSALDIAIECSGRSQEVYLSTRRGGWINPRTVARGYPIDAYNNRRLNLFLNRILPMSWRTAWVEKALSQRFDHENFGIKPNHRALRQYPITNDVINANFINGTVKLKPKISHFTPQAVVFEGEDIPVDLDTVIFATGYRLLYPYLTGFQVLEDKLGSLYKLVFPTEHDHPTLAFIGLVVGAAAVIPVSEIQARWAVRVFTKKVKLPSKKRMAQDARNVQLAIDKRFYKGFGNRVFIHGPVYTDEIASFIGAKPNLLKLFFLDPKLFWACLFGPMLPYHYRLSGPHPWSGARDATISADRRFNQKIQRVGKSDVEKCFGGNLWKWTVAVVLIAGFGIGASTIAMRRVM